MPAETPEQPRMRLPIGGTGLQNRIADAAIELFYSRGALATTVRDITSACGLTPGALYNHFTSKEQLLYVLIRDIHLEADAQLEAAVAGAAPDPVSRLAAAVSFLVGQAAGQRQQSRVANREFITLTDTRRTEVTGIRRRMRGRLTEILLDGGRQGLFTVPGGPDRVSAALTATVIGTICANISEWTQENYPIPMADLQERYVLMALRLAGTQPAGA
jgi:AcrR family transcriptional regulator